MAFPRRPVADEPLLTPSQVAAMLGKERSTVFRIPPGELPFVLTAGGEKRKGHRRYRQRDVDKYVGTRADPPLAERVARLEERVDRLESK